MGRVVIVALENIPKSGHRHVVRIAHVARGGRESGAIGIDPHGEPARVDVAIGALFSNALRVAVIATGDEVAAVLCFDVGSGISEGEVPLAGWGTHDGVEGVVVTAALEAGEEDLALVDRGIEDGVSIDVGVNDDRGRGGKDDLVIENGDAEGGMAEAFFRDEDVGGIRFAIVVGVLENDD